ncbi:MAG: hypothetical protein [brine shrimp arlivirus 2]|nr:MAG: hypothetical protein [brine shrimp arlivirus 2]
MAKNQKPTCTKNDRNIICRMDCPLTHYRYDPPSPTDPNYSAWLEGRLKSLKENQRIMLGSLSGDLNALSEAVIHVSNQLNVIKDQIANMSYFRGITDQPGSDLRHRAAPPQPRRQIEPSIAPMVQESYATNRNSRQFFRGSNRRYRSKSAHPRAQQGEHHWGPPNVGPPRSDPAPATGPVSTNLSYHGQIVDPQPGSSSWSQAYPPGHVPKQADSKLPDRPVMVTKSNPSTAVQLDPEHEAKMSVAWARSIELLEMQPYDTEGATNAQAGTTANIPENKKQE